jgi:hypothetical protein
MDTWHGLDEMLDLFFAHNIRLGVLRPRIDTATADGLSRMRAEARKVDVLSTGKGSSLHDRHTAVAAELLEEEMEEEEAAFVEPQPWAVQKPRDTGSLPGVKARGSFTWSVAEHRQLDSLAVEWMGPRGVLWDEVAAGLWEVGKEMGWPKRTRHACQMQHKHKHQRTTSDEATD